MPINAHPEYFVAEKEYLSAQTPDEQIEKLEKLISVAPTHKGAENLRAQLKTRLKKLKEKLIKSKKTGKSKAGIKKEAIQVILVGKTNTGKSSLLSNLTNTSPEISEFPFTTKQPLVGMMPFAGTQIQLIENPAAESEFYDKGLPHTADIILLLINSLEELKELEPKIKNSPAKKIIVFNKSDILSEKEKRKISATLQSKKYNFILISAKTSEGIKELQEKIFQNLDKLRIYTKEPHKEKSKKPIIFNPGATVANVAEKILSGFSRKIKQTKIWGPSSKFPGQVVGLQHKLKDLDVVEFKTN